jgi:TRAP-type C4-dicarboxylate transport system permease small subunit
MPITISSSLHWIRRRAENIVAVLLGIMFVAFLVQIVFRYFFNFPVGWTSELSVITWLYMVLLGSAFWLKESEEVRFDLISGALGPAGKRVVGLIVAIAAVVLFAMALPATISYVTFMNVYVVFAIAVIGRYAWATVSLLRGDAPEEADITKANSGL